MHKTFVNSLPKSGTNLLAKGLLLFGYREKGHLSAGSILDRNFRATLRKALWLSKNGPYTLGVNNPIRVRAWPIDRKLKRLKSGQFISAHVGYDDGILQRVLANQIKPIQVLRDPRAVLASFIPYVLNDPRHFLHNTFSRMSTEERLHATLYGYKAANISVNPMRVYCQALDPWASHPEVLCIKFENIVGEQGGGTRESLLASLEALASALHLPGDQIEYVADNLYGPGRHTFRKGQVDTWRDELPSHFIAEMDSELEPVLSLWNYQ